MRQLNDGSRFSTNYKPPGERCLCSIALDQLQIRSVISHRRSKYHIPPVEISALFGTGSCSRRGKWDQSVLLNLISRVPGKIEFTNHLNSRTSSKGSACRRKTLRRSWGMSCHSSPSRRRWCGSPRRESIVRRPTLSSARQLSMPGSSRLRRRSTWLTCSAIPSSNLWVFFCLLHLFLNLQVRERVLALANSPISFTGRSASQTRRFFAEELQPAIAKYAVSSTGVQLDVWESPSPHHRAISRSSIFPLLNTIKAVSQRLETCSFYPFCSFFHYPVSLFSLEYEDCSIFYWTFMKTVSTRFFKLRISEWHCGQLQKCPWHGKSATTRRATARRTSTG